MDWLHSSDLDSDRAVIVPLELRGQTVVRGSLEVLGQATRLAQQLEVPVQAVALSPLDSDMEALVARHGAQRLLVISGGQASPAGPAEFALLLESVVRRVDASAVLMAATPWGQERAARLSARLGLDLASSITTWRLDEDGAMVVSRPVYGGRLVEEVELQTLNTRLATLRPSLFPLIESGNGCQPDVQIVEPPDPTSRAATLVEALQRGEDDKPLAEARIVVSGGTGVGGPEGFEVLRDLAEAVGGVIGASRAAVDAGWVAPELQVGQTGTVVSPDVYFACGISGAVQHRAGIRTARFIVAINIDPAAPIFRFSDAGIVGDLFDVVPILTAELRRRSQPSLGVAREVSQP